MERIDKIFALVLVYLLFIAFICLASNRIQNLNENSYTEEGHNKSIVLVK